MGGVNAIGDGVAVNLQQRGYKVTRVAGADRYDTAVQVAGHLHDPSTVLLATGLDFPDGLTAGAAAGHSLAAVLLTDGATMAPATSRYLAVHASDVTYAVGGAATMAAPAATPLAGADRYATAVSVASRLFATTTRAAVASGASSADALAGGVYASNLDTPLLLTDPSTLSTATAAYLNSHRSSVTDATIFGGPAAVSDATASQVAAAIA